jgi:hypothetical protein
MQGPVSQRIVSQLWIGLLWTDKTLWSDTVQSVLKPGTALIQRQSTHSAKSLQKPPELDPEPKQAWFKTIHMGTENLPLRGIGFRSRCPQLWSPLKHCAITGTWNIVKKNFKISTDTDTKPENSVFIGSWQSVGQCLFCGWHLGYTVWHVVKTCGLCLTNHS